MNWRKAAALIAGISVCAVLVSAQPASAHTVSGSGATNYRTSLQSVTPYVPGLKLSVQEAGNRMQLENDTGQRVIILGYQGEPYLEMTATGVYENMNSPSTYLNITRYATTVAPGFATAAATPDWHRIRNGSVAIWHDHRVHWMSTREPPQVRGSPNQVHTLIPQWQLQMVVGSTPVTATGDLVWIPGSSPLAWILLSLLSCLATLLVVRQPGRRITIAGLLGALVAIDAWHTIGLGWAAAGVWTDKLYKLASSFYSLFLWAVALHAARLIYRKRANDAVFFVIFVGVCLSVISGFGDVSMLYKSQLVFDGPWWMGRTAVALSIGIGIGLVISGVTWMLTQRNEMAVEIENDEAGTRDFTGQLAAVKGAH